MWQIDGHQLHDSIGRTYAVITQITFHTETQQSKLYGTVMCTLSLYLSAVQGSDIWWANSRSSAEALLYCPPGEARLSVWHADVVLPGS